MNPNYKEANIDVPDEIMGDLGIGFHPGYSTPFCKQQAEGAIANGTVIEKVNSGEGDANSDGSIGVVLGSLGPVPDGSVPEFPNVRYFYFVEWDSDPGVAVGCVDFKLRVR